MKKIYDSLVVKCTAGLSTLCVSLLFLISIGVTSDMTFTTDSAPYQYVDYPIVHMGIIIPLAIIIFYLIRNKTIEKSKLDNLHIIICIAFALLIICFFGYVSVDPQRCLHSARALSGQTKYEPMLTWYIGKYPYQSTFILYEFIFVKLFGSYDFIIIQLMSVIMYALSLFYIRKIITKMMEGTYSWKIDLCMLLFLPGWLISEFSYNDIPSLVFAMAGIWLFLSSSKDWKRILAFILIGVSCAMRSSNLILLIALVIVNIFDEKNCKILLYAVIGIVSYKMISIGSLQIIAARFPEIIEKTMNYPIERWLYIGISKSKTGAGWWAPDTAVDGLHVISLFRERLTYLITNPIEFIEFEIKKLANGYAMPDFETIDSFRNKLSLFQDSEILKNFLYDRNIWYSGLYFIMNCFQSLTYFGTILYLKIKKNKTKLEIFGLIFFIGNFLFYIFWEIKARYLLIPIIFLIPYGIKGYDLLIQKISKKDIFKYLVFVPFIILLAYYFQSIILTENNLIRVTAVNQVRFLI